MLKLEIKASEFFDETTNQFIDVAPAVLELEHSLLAMSKWESKYKKPFLTETEKTTEEVVNYIQFMILNADFSPEVVLGLTNENMVAINAYLEDPMTATTIKDLSAKKGGPRQVITTELIYYWMTAYQIPFEAEVWNLNRLFMLIRIADINNSPPKKMTQQEIRKNQWEQNEERLSRYKTNG